MFVKRGILSRFNSNVCFSTSIGRENNLKIGVIGAPFRCGQAKEGVEKGAEAIRKLGLIESLRSIRGVADVKDYGDVCLGVPEGPKTLQQRFVNTALYNKMYSEKVQQVICDNRMVVNLGGDHAMAVGTIHGHSAARGVGNVGVLWLDAHGDINTPITSDTGNLHGMPVGFLLKEIRSTEYYPKKLPEMDWCKPCLTANDVSYIGLRSVDDYERLFMNTFHIAAYDMYRVDRLGALGCVREALNRIDPDNKKSLHLSFDIDALDPVEAPSTGTPVRGGLTLREGITIVEELYATGRLDVIDLVEVNPMLGNEQDAKKTTVAAKFLIEAACGQKRGGDLPKDPNHKPKHSPLLG